MLRTAFFVGAIAGSLLLPTTTLLARGGGGHGGGGHGGGGHGGGGGRGGGVHVGAAGCMWVEGECTSAAVLASAS